MILGMSTATFTLIHVLTSITGYFFPNEHVTPGMILGGISLFVAVVQAFMKVPALKELAPHQSAPPFLIAQTILLALFVAMTIRASMKFRNVTATA